MQMTTLKLSQQLGRFFAFNIAAAKNGEAP
jgi:hypothetical protein